MTNKYTDQVELDIDDDLPFGKYKGSSVRRVLAVDPDYLRWIAHESNDWAVSSEVEEALEDELLRQELIEE